MRASSRAGVRPCDRRSRARYHRARGRSPTRPAFRESADPQPPVARPSSPPAARRRVRRDALAPAQRLEPAAISEQPVCPGRGERLADARFGGALDAARTRKAFFGSSLAPSPITVRWEIAHDDKFDADRRGRARRSQPRELAHSVHVEVAGLEPDRWYFYRFMAGDAPERRRAARAPSRHRRRGAAPALRLRLLPALGARLLQRLPPHARGEPRRRAVPRRLHLRVSRTRRMRCACPPGLGAHARRLSPALRAPQVGRRPAGDARRMPLARDLGRPRGAERLRRRERGRQRPAGGRLRRRGAPRPTRPITSTCRCARRVLTRALAGLGSGAEMRIYSQRALRHARVVPPRSTTGSIAIRKSAPAAASPARARSIPPRAPSGRIPERTLLGAAAGALARRRLRARRARAGTSSACRRCSGSAISGPGAGPIALERRLGRLPRRPRAA